MLNSSLPLQLPYLTSVLYAKSFRLLSCLCVAGLLLAHDDPGLFEQDALPADWSDNAVTHATSSGVQLLSRLSLQELGGQASNVKGNDHWGWYDEGTGREYVIMGKTNGVAFVDISDPRDPVYLGSLPSPGNANTTWADVKVYRNYAYIVKDNAYAGVQIFDLRKLNDVGGDLPVTFHEDGRIVGEDAVTNCHNIFIDEQNGTAYFCGTNNGTVIYDLSADPLNPTLLEKYTSFGYWHDVQVVPNYQGPDSDYTGRDIAFVFNGYRGISILDVTNPMQVTSVVSFLKWPSAEYLHQGWASDDLNYLFVNDELDEYFSSSEANTYTVIYNISDLDSPELTSGYSHPTQSIDHNLYVKGNLVFQANYTAGLRVLEFDNNLNISLHAYYDTFPANDDAGFNGAWSVYPFFPSGVVTVSDIESGLFVLKLDDNPTDLDNDQLPDGWETSQFGTLDAEPADDVDGDGVANTQEFLFAGDPLMGDANGALLEYDLDESSDQFSIRFKRPRDYSKTGWKYRLRYSDDLIEWRDLQDSSGRPVAATISTNAQDNAYQDVEFVVDPSDFPSGKAFFKITATSL